MKPVPNHRPWETPRPCKKIVLSKEEHAKYLEHVGIYVREDADELPNAEDFRSDTIEKYYPELQDLNALTYALLHPGVTKAATTKYTTRRWKKEATIAFGMYFVGWTEIS